MMDEALVRASLALTSKLSRECHNSLLAFQVLRIELQMPLFPKTPQMEDMAGFVLQLAFLSVVLPGA